MSKNPSIDELMESLARQEIDLDARKNDADEQILAIKAALKDETEPLQKEIASLRGKINRLAKKKAEKGETHTKTPFGTVSVSKNPPKLEVADEARTLRLIRSTGKTGYIRTYEEPDLEAMTGESDDFLTAVGIVRRQNISVHIKVDKAKAASRPTP